MNMTQEIIEMVNAEDFDWEELALLHRTILKARGLPYAGHEDEYTTVVTSIKQGRLDTGLEVIRNACLERSATLDGAKNHEEPRKPRIRYRKNDLVRINSTALRPKYLNGQEFKVVRHNRTTVTVGPIPNDDAYGRFAGQRELRIPLSAVEPV